MAPSRGGAERPARIGVDLDNTLCDYSAVFGPVGVELGLLPPFMASASKREVKDRLFAETGGETDWMRLQGQVYGRFLPRAAPYHGAFEALGRFVASGATVSVVSHKTRYGHFDEHGVDLWEAARVWLSANGLERCGLSLQDVHFLETRDEKVARIRDLECAVFIDDLLEVLLHKGFPAATRPIWFHGPGVVTEFASGLEPCLDWVGVERAVLFG